MKNSNLKYQIATGVILIIVGIALLLNNYISDKREEVFSSMNLSLSEVEDEIESDDTTLEKSEEEGISSDTDTNVEETNYEKYAGTLEIPKIGFYKGFYSKNSDLNNVKYNIKILDVSSYPDEPKGNVIIIGHSGNYSNSYFGNLYQLVVYFPKNYNTENIIQHISFIFKTFLQEKRCKAEF